MMREGKNDVIELISSVQLLGISIMNCFSIDQSTRVQHSVEERMRASLDTLSQMNSKMSGQQNFSEVKPEEGTP